MPHHVLAATESTGAGEPTDDSLSACLEWAMKTASGRPPKKWSPPPVEAIDELIPEGAATVRAGDVVRQCVVERADHRLALRCPIVSDVREALPAPRRRWFARLVLESQAQWRMVRVGFEDRALVAETDLTGAPIDAGLVHAAIDAMCSVIGWLAGPADLIAGTVESETLKIDPASWIS